LIDAEEEYISISFRKLAKMAKKARKRLSGRRSCMPTYVQRPTDGGGRRQRKLVWRAARAES